MRLLLIALAVLLVDATDVFAQQYQVGDWVVVVTPDAPIQLGREVVDRGYVIEKGRVVLQGTTAELKADPARLERHLGVGGE